MKPSSAAAAIFSGMPPTGPMVPVALIVPVIVTCSANASPLASAMRPAVVSAPALGPSIRPSVANRNSPSSGSPSSSVEMMAAFHAPACDWEPMPPTSFSENSTRKSPGLPGCLLLITVVPVAPFAPATASQVTVISESAGAVVDADGVGRAVTAGDGVCGGAAAEQAASPRAAAMTDAIAAVYRREATMMSP